MNFSLFKPVGKFLVIKTQQHNCKLPSKRRILRENVTYGDLWICFKCGDSWRLDREFECNISLSFRDKCKNLPELNNYRWTRLTQEQLNKYLRYSR